MTRTWNRLSRACCATPRTTLASDCNPHNDGPATSARDEVSARSARENAVRRAAESVEEKWDNAYSNAWCALPRSSVARASSDPAR